MVPIYKRYLFLDLVKDLDIPMLIVSRPGLGTINHTLLTVEAARDRGIEICGIIINYTTKKKGLAERTNPEVIEGLSDVPVLGIVPYSKGASTRSIKRAFSEIVRSLQPLQ